LSRAVRVSTGALPERPALRARLLPVRLRQPDVRGQAAGDAADAAGPGDRRAGGRPATGAGLPPGPGAAPGTHRAARRYSHAQDPLARLVVGCSGTRESSAGLPVAELSRVPLHPAANRSK